MNKTILWLKKELLELLPPTIFFFIVFLVMTLVKGLIEVMDHEDANGRMYNIGNPQENTILEMAELLKQLTNSSSEIVDFRSTTNSSVFCLWAVFKTVTLTK